MSCAAKLFCMIVVSTVDIARLPFDKICMLLQKIPGQKNCYIVCMRNLVMSTTWLQVHKLGNSVLLVQAQFMMLMLVCPSPPHSLCTHTHVHTLSSHPYIFFNQDRESITFMGFIVTQNGDLIDPTHQKILERAIITPKLYKGLKANKVNFDEDYRMWQKWIMIEKLARVMGIEFTYDPDESYVLTVDNLIKIMAIQMRFRSVCPYICILMVSNCFHLPSPPTYAYSYTGVVSQWS